MIPQVFYQVKDTAEPTLHIGPEEIRREPTIATIAKTKDKLVV
jgi:hypothetical protein